MYTKKNIVKQIKLQELDTALKSASLAYKNYPLFNYLIGQSNDVASIRGILNASVKASKSDIIGFSVGEKNQAVAFFIKPNYKGTRALPFLLSCGAELIFKHSPQIIYRLLRQHRITPCKKGKKMV